MTFQEMWQSYANLQGLWLAGHAITLLQAVVYAITRTSWNYQAAYVGCLVAYAVTLYKAHPPHLSQKYLQELLLDENSVYLLLAVLWLSSPALILTLVPFSVFALFHLCSFAKTRKVMLVDRILLMQERVLFGVAMYEILLFPAIVAGVFWGMGIFSPVFYFQFLAFKHLLSQNTQRAMRLVDSTLDTHVAKSAMAPKWLTNGYVGVRRLVVTYGDLQAKAKQE